LEPDLEATIVTGYDTLVDDQPELARTLSASGQQRIALVFMPVRESVGLAQDSVTRAKVQP
jgi:hypothetical protein